MLDPEVSFDDYLAAELEPDEVEVNPVDLSMASMSAGAKGEPGAEVRAALLTERQMCGFRRLLQSCPALQYRAYSGCHGVWHLKH